MQKMALQIDDVLHNGRNIAFSDYSEGEAAILANELDKLVAKLRLTTEQLEAEKRALSDELADISHQIRTPLTAISLSIPLIGQTDDSVQRKELLRNLETMIDRVSWLVATLLKMAKADAGALNMTSSRVSVRAVAERSLLPMELQFDLRGVEMVSDICSDASFEGDAFWTAEALQNVIKNCLEHTPPGGRVSVKGAEDALATRITVTDTGCGISPEDLPYLFERFYRGSKDAHRPDGQIEGFGVGLALAKSLIVAQGGSIRAGNVCDSGGNILGAKFEIAFPKILV